MANQPLNKNYFIASVLIHLFIMFGISYMIKRDALSSKNFVIFGTHSRHTTKALYKSSAVPFTGGPSQNRAKKGSKGKGKKSTKENRSLKKLSKKNSRMPATKKSKSTEKKPSLKKLFSGKQLAMPSPTAMIEESAHRPSKKKSAKKKKLTRKITPPPPSDDEIEAATLPPLEQIDPPHKEDHKQLPVDVHEDASKTDTPTTPSEQDDFHTDATGDGDDGDVIHVGVVDSTDPVTRYHQRIISQEVSRLWHPPAGVRKGTECTVRITIDAKGAINTIDFIKHSQVPIYDLSILRLKITKPEFPPSLYGKHMIVVFHQ